MDSLLTAALLQSFRTTCSEKKAELPMLSSNLYRLHMVPNSPNHLDVKKSSHKKLGKFLASMERLGVLKVSELSKGVESVVWVDWQHEMVATAHSSQQPQTLESIVGPLGFEEETELLHGFIPS